MKKIGFDSSDERRRLLDRSTMSSEKFETLDEDVEVLCQALIKKLETRLPHCFGEERKQTISEIERGLDDAKQILFDMEAEARAAPSPYRLDMIATVRKHRDAVARITQSLKSILARDIQANMSRDLVFESGSAGYASSSRNRPIDEATQRTVMQGRDILDRTSQSIYRSTQVALETEQIGTEVIGNLGEQRETLVRARERLTDTDAELGRARRVLNSMSRTALTNKLVLIVIIILEIAILSGLVYYKFFS